MIDIFVTPVGFARRWRLALRGAQALAAGIALTACGSGESELPGATPMTLADDARIDVAMRIQPPAQIDALTSVELEYTIELKGAGIVTRVDPGSDFTVPFSVSGSARYYYRIEIRARSSGLLLAMREGSRWLDRHQTLLIGDEHFVSDGAEFDNDSDGVSNLDELSDGRNPSIPESTQLLFSFRVAGWVQALYDDGLVRFETLIDTLGNDDGKFPIAYNSGSGQFEAIGTGLAAGGQPHNVGISIRIDQVPYHFGGSGLSLAAATRFTTLRAGLNREHFEWGDFNTDWDLDRDGTTNLQELRRGTDPTANGPELSIPVVAGGVSPVIDGSLDEASWYALQPAASGGNAQSIDALLAGGAGPETTGRLFTAVHDFTHLYIGVQIRDDAIVIDSQRQRWLDDSIEIYIDGDNSRASSYDGDNDLAMNFRFTDGSAQRADLSSAAHSAAIPQSLQYAMTHDFERGLTQLELMLPMADLSIDRHAGIGLAVQYNDDDDGGERDRKYGWRGPDGADHAWWNPTWFGEIEFVN